jgi:hypothetical protein
MELQDCPRRAVLVIEESLLEMFSPPVANRRAVFLPVQWVLTVLKSQRPQGVLT